MARQYSGAMQRYSEGLNHLVDWMLQPDPLNRPSVLDILESDYIKQKMMLLCQQTVNVQDSTTKWLLTDKMETDATPSPDKIRMMHSSV